MILPFRVLRLLVSAVIERGEESVHGLRKHDTGGKKRMIAGEQPLRTEGR
jgi:hypothetical protein